MNQKKNQEITPEEKPEEKSLRKPYERPELVRLGEAQELTRADVSVQVP